MNEYTRREEVRWTLIAAAVLVLCVGASIVLLMTAVGRLVPDPAAREAANQAALVHKQASGCVPAADKLMTEVEFFKTTAKTARLREADTEPKLKKKTSRFAPKEKEPDVDLAWASAQPTFKQAKILVACHASSVAAIGERDNAAPAWKSIEVAAAVPQPSGGDKPARAKASLDLLDALENAQIDKVAAMVRDADAALKKAADDASKHADTATVREPLAGGLLPREGAMIVGVVLALAALLVSFLSVRVASMRRLTALVPLRGTQQPGIQAASILKLAAQPNGGEPGLVMGAALGGLLAASLRAADADVFVMGVMGGLLVGLLVQWGLRFALGMSKWRIRATELGEVEKPTIPIVLVLSGVNQGLEAQFLEFFDGLEPYDAAETVTKLAAQAEERILVAADAGAARSAQQPQMFPQNPQNPGPGGHYPGG